MNVTPGIAQDDSPDISGAPDRSASLAALASTTRRHILHLLARGEHTISDIVEITGLHRATVRHHVQTLLRADLIQEVRRVETKKAGRPPVVYSLKHEARSDGVGYPVRHYDVLAEIALEALVGSLGEREAGQKLREVAKARGMQMVRYIEATAGVQRWSPEAFRDAFVLGVGRQMGMETEMLSMDERHVRYRMFSCPFQELAEKRVDLVCDHMDRGFFDGVLKAIGPGPKFRRHACIAHGDAFCEYELRWPSTKRREVPAEAQEARATTEA